MQVHDKGRVVDTGSLSCVLCGEYGVEKEGSVGYEFG